jgi:hypothetical protein
MEHHPQRAQVDRLRVLVNGLKYHEENCDSALEHQNGSVVQNDTIAQGVRGRGCCPDRKKQTFDSRRLKGNNYHRDRKLTIFPITHMVELKLIRNFGFSKTATLIT